VLKETVAAAAFSLTAAAAVAADGPGLDPAKGRFLVARRGLQDPNFRETVVLLTEVSVDGAMGLIVNWPTAAPAAELIPQIDGIGGLDRKIFVGGPVSRQVMLMLFRSAENLPQAERIFADVHLSTSRDLLERLVAGEIESADLRLYSGHAGWAPGQLDLELEAGGWLVLPGDAELVFAADPDRVWPELVRRGDLQWTRHAPATASPPAP
jgi:putative transcriptional regulator